MPIVLSLFAVNYFSAASYNNNIKFLSPTFLYLVFVFAFLIINEQRNFAYANQIQTVSLGEKFEKIMLAKEEAAGRHVVTINAEEIYKAKCTACHRLNEKLIGPPHLEVIKKYIGKKEALAAFILNPRKVDPAYPAMPSQGLTAKEASAMADYMLNVLGKNIK